MIFTPRDEYWMQHALTLAAQAGKQAEIPVGAVLVADDKLIGEGFNAPISLHDPTAHAEILALRQGAQFLQNYRLINTTLYVSLEPCLMCVGAMVHARIARLVYAANDPKTGAIQSQCAALDYPFHNHRIKYAGGLLAEIGSQLLSEFFRKKRQKL